MNSPHRSQRPYRPSPLSQGYGVDMTPLPSNRPTPGPVFANHNLPPPPVVLGSTGIPRRGAIDMRAAGRVKADYWHPERAHHVVNNNFDPNCPNIMFIPDDGVCAGVAMSECMYGTGIAYGASSTVNYIPSAWAGLDKADLSIEWPGYEHLKYRRGISFKHRDGRPYTVSEMGAQVANIFRDFIEKHGELWDRRRRDAIPLGPKANVKFEDLRLLQLFAGADRTKWSAEVSYALSD